MAQHKVVYRFRPSLNAPPTANATSGWSEVFYRAANETDADAITSAKGMLTGRRRLLTSGWRCRSITAYRYPNSRTGVTETVSNDDGVGLFPMGGVTDEQPYDVLIVHLPSADGKTRHWGMRGIASNVVDAGGSFLNPGLWIGRFDGWKLLIADGSWALRVATPRGAFYPTDISLAGNVGAYTATPFSPVIIYGGVPGFTPAAADDTIRFSGVRTVTGLNGLWIVRAAELVAGVWHVQLKPKRGARVSGSYDGEGNSRVITYALSVITSASEGDGSSHKVGGLPGRRRGRRPRPQP